MSWHVMGPVRLRNIHKNLCQISCQLTSEAPIDTWVMSYCRTFPGRCGTRTDSEMSWTKSSFLSYYHFYNKPHANSTTCLGPNGSCLFAAGSPTDTVGSQKVWTFSTRQIAFGGGADDAGTAAMTSASVCRRYQNEPWTGLDNNTH